MSDIITIKGSARRNGNSDRILSMAVNAIRESSGADLTVKTITASKLDITPCRSCHGCWETGRCVIQDNMQDIYKQCLEARNIIVSAPIYFTSLPGQLKIVIDRFQCFWVRTYRLGAPPRPRRNGMFLCTGAMEDNRFFENASLIVRVWMSTLNVKCRIARFYPGLDAPDDIDTRPDYHKDITEAGRKMQPYI